MSAKVIDFQDFKLSQNSEQDSEYRLLKELMLALFGPVDEDECAHPITTEQDELSHLKKRV